MLKQQMRKLMFLMLLGLTVRQVSCANQQTVSPLGKVWGAIGSTVTVAGKLVNSVNQSSFGRKFCNACEGIAAYTIFETIKKVGIRSTATLLTTKPLVFPMACYLLAPLASSVLSRWHETVKDSEFDNSESDSPERDQKREAFVENRWWKMSTLQTCKQYIDMLPLASVLCFLTLVQPLSVSVSSRVLR